MQHQLKTRHPLVDQNGHLIEAGWATEYILDYNKEDVKRQEELREWEYYLSLTKDYALGVSIAGTGGGQSRRLTVHFMNFAENHFDCDTEWVDDPDLKGFAMPRDANQSIHFEGPLSQGDYRREGNSIYIDIHKPNLAPGKDLSAKLRLDIPNGDKTLIVVPYADPELFYYNYKINCMPVTGEVLYGGTRYEFTPEIAMGTYDSGRGIWEPVNQWYWGSASTILNGVPFGFNIGHGFGDTSMATENMILYDGRCHKLDQIQFQIPGDNIGDLRLVLPEENYLQPWRFVTNDGRLDMDFQPVMDRTSLLTPGEYFAGQHQVFGHFSGAAVLDDGQRIEFKDLFGFAEKVGNAWL